MRFGLIILAMMPAGMHKENSFNFNGCGEWQEALALADVFIVA